MKTFYIVVLFSVVLLCGCAGRPAAGPYVSESGSEPDSPRVQRRFEFLYSADITNIPMDAKDVRIWFPVPQSDKNQRISRLEIKTPESCGVHTGPVYGNKIGYIHVTGAPPPSIPVSLSFEVTRYEDRGGNNPSPPGGDVHKFLQPSRRGAITPEVSKAASGIEDVWAVPQDRLKAAYQYVIDNMEYKKEGTGWGHGDTAWACRVGYGNCTDYHALFIALSQAMGVPANFEIGFSLPPGETEGTVGGYHCWAHYYIPEEGWVPVDVSEADKRPVFKDYFFGAHDPNRIKFTTGRDIILEPRQKGGPLNYFIYPYVEVDGIRHEDMTLRISFRDISE